MGVVNTEQRSLLERTVVAARAAAETAARAALQTLAVDQNEPFAGLPPEQRRLRNQLRAEERRLGGPDALVAECAFGQWHRMLFARFLAENGLLIHPEAGVPVTLDECAELAPDENEPDAWMLAARYAATMLPGIFRTDDPVLQVRFAAEGRQALEALLGALPPDVFVADDSLGWVYQFWQSKAKKEVNASGRKVGGADIAPVTQLFTEHYMVEFLLHNTLGAWWTARHPGEATPVPFTYLRLGDDGTPAAGTFPAWPDRARDLRVMDPCCGSGHFMVAAFDLLVRFRMAKEGLSARDAGDAVLRNNLFGLELDPRCTQIAAFALALAAWKSGGYRPLPVPNIACSGLPVGARLYDWTNLADMADVPTERDRIDLQHTLRQLYHAFSKAPDLGSLIDPQDLSNAEALFAFRWDEIQPLLERALVREKGDDPAAGVFGRAAKGVAKAARLLSGKYDLVVTNVPYLARGKQGDALQEFCGKYYANAKADLATVFLHRCLKFCDYHGAVAAVTPQNWLFLGSYAGLRGYLLRQKTWNVVARLGPGAFETIGGEVVNVGLFVLTNAGPKTGQHFAGLDASAPRTPRGKVELLAGGPVQTINQAVQLRNPDGRIALDETGGGTLLERYAAAFQGIKTGDDGRYRRSFWELAGLGKRWRLLQSTVDAVTLYGGRESVVDWCQGGHDMARLQGQGAWLKPGIAISQMNMLPCALYDGEFYDSNMSPIIPRDPVHLPAVWAFCSSLEFRAAVRRIDQSLKPTNATLVKVPFDLERWQKVADEQYPNGLPEPHSDDPTQWLFHGHPARSTDPLQVAVARLLGYKWPRQTGAEVSGCGPVPDDGLDAHADADGIVCLPPVAGEPPAAERLRALLAAAHGPDWSPAVQERLLADAGHGGKGLDDWLRDGFFAAHCRRFHNRPFVWHVWDGRKDGFSALVNYHRLDRAKLDRLIYTYLGAWINAQRDAEARGEAGTNARLVAALDLQMKLQAIADGEPPYDIYIRWKPLAEQPLGWVPDLNDGVRLNVRPFVIAGVFRSKFTINWNKDRGMDPNGSERINDRHVSRAEKEAARRSVVNL